MVTSNPIRSLFLYAVAVLCLLSVGTTGVSADGGKSQDEEVQMGNEVFNELKAKGEIIESSPLYDQLKPIADAITRAAQPATTPLSSFFLFTRHNRTPSQPPAAIYMSWIHFYFS
jgi:hypothetical protein